MVPDSEDLLFDKTMSVTDKLSVTDKPKSNRHIEDHQPCRCQYANSTQRIIYMLAQSGQKYERYKTYSKH